MRSPVRAHDVVAPLLVAVLVIAPAAPIHAQDATVQPRINELIAPLATVPAIVEDGDVLTVELDGAVGPLEPGELTATLTPSFGAADITVPATATAVTDAAASDLWPRRRTTQVRFEIDWSSLGTDGPVDDLFDLRVSWPGGSDRQPRAVHLTTEFPDEPTFAVLADPSVGDPRPVQEGATSSVSEGSVDPLVHNTTNTVGAGTDQQRWAALNRAIDEINLMDPDVVFVTGDLTFGLHTRGVAYEYEEAYRVINRLRAPTFVTPGNHDLYTFDPQDRQTGVDGWDVWPELFGPLHYTTELDDGVRVVSINTFDWAQSERIPADPETREIRSGGQIRGEQLAWLTDELRSWRASHPDGVVVSLAHHDPSWLRNRHPWAGANRLPLRDLLAETDVGVHFSGHKHNDRVARFHEGNVVETNGQNDGEVGRLHYVRRDDTLDDAFSQQRLGQILRTPAHGPLFVTTTTAASGLQDEEWGLGGYWGYRFGVLAPQGTGFDPIDFGYPATREFLDETAERPENWNPDHARFGLFSYPSFHIDAATDAVNDGSESEVRVELTSELLHEVVVTVPISLAAGSEDRVVVEGGELRRRRSGGGATDLWVAADLAPDAQRTVVARVAPAGPADAGGTDADPTADGSGDRSGVAAPLPATGAGLPAATAALLLGAGLLVGWRRRS